MEGPEMLSVEVPTCSEAIPIPEGTNGSEERSRICPLCGSVVRFFFLNLQEQILLCENMECQFPFGYEDLQFNKFEDRTMSEVASIRTKPSHSLLMSPTGSVISTHAWSEIDKINKVLESEDSQLDRPVFYSHQDRPIFDSHIEKERSTKKMDKDCRAKIKQNVEHIKGLNMELMELLEPKGIIKNEKWIKKLLNLQGISGSSLLKPQELKQLHSDKKSQPEIKINIQPGDSNTISSIKIDLA